MKKSRTCVIKSCCKLWVDGDGHSRSVLLFFLTLNRHKGISWRIPGCIDVIRDNNFS